MNSFSARRRALVPICALLLVGACSEHSDAPTEPVIEGDATVVLVRDFSFSAPSVTIDAGKSVRWRTTTGTFHTVTPDGNQAFAEREFNGSGETFEVRFDVPGRYRYFCEVHRSFGMTGEIVVR
jgi:plastocyanin